MSKLLDNVLVRSIRQFMVFDDFHWYISPHQWTATLTDSGAVTQTDAAGGVITLQPSDGSVADNDEAYLATTKEIFLVAQDKPLYAECRVKFTEAATNAANVAFGFQNAVGANSIIDDGAGLKVSGDTIAIYKVDGGTVWKCVSVCNGGTPTITTTTKAAGGGVFQRLGIEVLPLTSVLAKVNFYLDGLLIASHDLTYTSATETQLFLGLKNGSANQETLYADYAGAVALR